MARCAAAPFLHRSRALDGLRGVSAVAVVLYHVHHRYAGAGFLGVDVFFVLSGYLITNLLLAERARHGSIQLLRFWSRRLVRLWPPLIAILLLTATFPRGFSPDGTVDGFVRDALSAGSWTMNLTMALDPLDIRPLGHTWSLGLEEQFYLLWPLILIGAVKAGLTRREIERLAASLAVGSLVIFEIAWKSTALLPSVYTRPDAHAFGILFGCAAALRTTDARWPGSRAERFTGRASTGLVAATAIVAAFVVPGIVDPEVHLEPALRIGAPLVSVASALLIAHVITNPRSTASRALSIRPVVGLGAISYSLYLVHQPAIGLVYLHSTHVPRTGHARTATELIVALAAAIILWALVERPARLLSRRIGPTAAPAESARGRRAARWSLASALGVVPVVLVLFGTGTAVTWTHTAPPARVPAPPTGQAPGPRP